MFAPLFQQIHTKVNSTKMQSLKKILCKKSTTKCHQKMEGTSEKDPLLGPNKQSYSSISTSDPVEETPQPTSGGPDGLRAWIVASAIFLVTMLMSGQARVASILFLDFMKFFHVGRKMASAPYSVKQSMKNLVGPVVGILGQKYGVRAVVITGGIMSALSSASCYFVADITWITFMWGAVGGMANGFTSSINQVVIDKYFKVYRTSASGLAFSGACVGAVFFSSFVEILIDKYGLGGTFLILGGVTMFVVPAAMILTEPPWSISSSKTRNELENRGTVPINNMQAANVVESLEKGEPDSSDKFVEKTTISKETNFVNDDDEKIISADFQFLQQNGDIVYKLLTDDVEGTNSSSEYDTNPEEHFLLRELDYMCNCLQQPANEAQKYIDEIKRNIESHNLEHSKSFVTSQLEEKSSKLEDTCNISNDNANARDVSIYSCKVPREVYFVFKIIELNGRKSFSLFSSLSDSDLIQATKVLNELKKLSQLFTEKGCTLNKHDARVCETAHETNSTSKDDVSQPNTIFNHIKTSIKLQSNLLYLLVCLSRGIYMLTFTPVLTAGVDFAIDKGLKKDDGIYVVGVLSLGDLIGRLCTGWITDRNFISLERYMMLVMIIQGISTATLPFFRGGTVLPALVVFAMLQGSLFVRHPVAVAKYLRPHEKSIGIGFINLPAGVLGFMLPSYIGYFRDKLGSYDNMFYINGGVCAAAGFLWAFEPFLMRYLPKK